MTTEDQLKTDVKVSAKNKNWSEYELSVENETKTSSLYFQLKTKIYNLVPITMHDSSLSHDHTTRQL